MTSFKFILKMAAEIDVPTDLCSPSDRPTETRPAFSKSATAAARLRQTDPGGMDLAGISGGRRRYGPEDRGVWDQKLKMRPKGCTAP
jgi:hypothetical protein